ncbi:hypothetical protein N7540_010883 [Penicillium herquei]|nr:hypothetical protein N7540_010883 [Penicillium herquei]
MEGEESPQSVSPITSSSSSGTLWEYLTDDTDDTDDIDIITEVEPSTPSDTQHVRNGKERLTGLETIYEDEILSDTNADANMEPFCVSPIEEINREPTDQDVEYLATAVVYEFAWRAGYMLQYPDTHHFNWLGQGVSHRSTTLPEESLAIMLAKPKVPEATDNYLVQSILRRAYRYLDPVVVCLDEEIDSSLLILRGSTLQRAAAGHCFKHYTSHGEWMYDSEEPAQQNTVDIGEIGTYLASNSIVGNGFVRNRHIRTRGEVQKIRDEEIAYPTGITRRRDPSRRYRPSTLRQCETITPETTVVDNTALIKRKPVPSHVASSASSTAVRVSLTSLTLTSIPISDMSPSNSTSYPSPKVVSKSEAKSPVPSPIASPASPTSVRVSPPSLTLASLLVSDASPSNSTSHPSTEVDSKSKAKARRPVRPARVSQASNATNSMDPSRDPNFYFSFPPSRIGESKLKRCFRKMKEFIQLQLSCVQGRR